MTNLTNAAADTLLQFAERAIAATRGLLQPPSIRPAGSPLPADDPPGSPDGQPLTNLRGEPAPSGNIHEARAAWERSYLVDQLARHNGNVSRTAKAIGMERSSMSRKLNRLGIDFRDARPRRKTQSNAEGSA